MTWKAREYGQNTHFIELAGEVNTAMPEHVINRVAEVLNTHGKPVKGSRVLVLGLAYKANIDDERESPSYILMDKLKHRGAEVSYYDPHVPEIRLTREYPHLAGMRSVEWKRENIAAIDVALVSTAHDAINYKELADWTPLIVDTRNALSDINTNRGQVWKA